MPNRRKFLKTLGGAVGGALWLPADPRGAEPPGTVPAAAASPAPEPPDLGDLVEKHFHKEGRS